MFKVNQDGNKVTLEIQTDLANEDSLMAVIPFEWRMNYAYSADLLARYLRGRIERAIADTRQDYYERGWRDAKSRGAKQTTFHGVM